MLWADTFLGIILPWPTPTRPSLCRSFFVTEARQHLIRFEYQLTPQFPSITIISYD